jgi:hypothetical protein
MRGEPYAGAAIDVALAVSAVMILGEVLAVSPVA